MKKRIFRSITGVTLFSILLLSIMVTFALHNELSRQQVENIQSELSYIESVADATENYEAHMSRFTTTSRITLIDEDGSVIFDNYKDIEQMDNHLNRPEVIEAIEGTSGEDRRLSDTLGEETYYYAKKMHDGKVLRLSFTDASIYSILVDAFGYLIAIMAVFVVIILAVSSYITKKIIKPIYPKNPNIYEELLPFVQKIEKQEQVIDRNKSELDQRMTEFETIAQNVADGLILIDKTENVLMINRRAAKILGTTDKCIGNPFVRLIRTPQIIGAHGRAREGKIAEEYMQVKEKKYLLKFSPIFLRSKVIGVVVMIVDYTKKAEAEKIRREFSANVSHELKTPLTAISGYAELLKSGMVDAEHIKPFAGKIYDEAQVLIHLIEDIMVMSKLDENVVNHTFEAVNLKESLQAIITRLESHAQKRNVEIQPNLVDCVITAVPTIINEIFYNLLQNSIKYNKDSGSVSIKMFEDETHINVEIRDTGIGMEADELDRIFERFYRVDTSHSKNIEGTGIGLAIVKHGVQLHKGTIETTSKVNEYTSFLVRFPKS